MTQQNSKKCRSGFFSLFARASVDFFHTHPANLMRVSKNKPSQKDAWISSSPSIHCGKREGKPTAGPALPTSLRKRGSRGPKTRWTSWTNCKKVSEKQRRKWGEDRFCVTDAYLQVLSDFISAVMWTLCVNSKWTADEFRRVLSWCLGSSTAYELV